MAFINLRRKKGIYLGGDAGGVASLSLSLLLLRCGAVRCGAVR